MIILDEYSYAKKLMNKGLSYFMSGRDIRILIKYFRYEEIDENDLYNKIVEYLNKWEKEFNELSYQKFLLDIIKTSKKSKIKKFDSVIITENEFDKIRSLKNNRLERILFTMLFLSKFYFQTGMYYNKEIKNKYTLKMSPLQICNFAKVNPKIKDWIFCDLFEAGVIDSEFNKDGAYYILDFYKNDDSDPKMIIDDIENFSNYYKYYCETCGKEIEKKNNKHTMCSECWKERKREHTRNAVKKFRKM